MMLLMPLPTASAASADDTGHWPLPDPTRRLLTYEAPVIFRSIHHPDRTRRPMLAVQAQAWFVGIVLVVVSTVGVAAALQGQAIFWPVVGAVAVGYALSVVAAQWRLRETPAEVEIRGALAVVRSVWDAAPGPRRDEALPVFEARLRAGELHVSLGDSVRTFRRAEWPDFDALVDAFKGAAMAARPEPVATMEPVAT